MCGLFCTAQPLEEGLLGPSAVRSGAKPVMVQRTCRGNGEKGMSAFDPIADVRSMEQSCPMSLEDHRRLVRRAASVACVVLALSIIAQTLMGADFRGLPFLAFGLILGLPAVGLLVRTIWQRFGVTRP